MFLIGFHCHTSQLWHTCGRKWEGAYSVVLRLEKESYVWEIKPVSIIIHLVGGGVRWQTAYLLSDGSYAAVVCLRVFACARSCACVWVEGGGEKEKEGASLANGSGRQVMHLCRQRRRRRCRVSRREREREGGKQSTSTATNPTPSSPLMPRSASSHRKGCCFFILVLKRGSKSYLFLADRILPSCPRKDFSSKVESMGSVQISKWDQFIKFDVWNRTTIAPVHPLAQAKYQLWRVLENERIQPLTLLRLPYRQSRMCWKCGYRLPWRRRLVEAWLISDLFSKARKWENTTVPLIFAVSIQVWIEATAGRCVVFRCVSPCKNTKRSCSYIQTIMGLLDIKL